MGISRYPRQGHRISPFTLKDILNFPIKSLVIPTISTFTDLDEKAWVVLDSVKANILVKEMFLNINLVSLPSYIKFMKFPCVPNWIEFDDLELEQRTYNCLKKNNLVISPQDFRKYKIIDLIELPGFGKLCLFDLLTSLENFVLPQNKDAQYEEMRQVSFEIKKIKNISDYKLIRSSDHRFKYIFQKIKLKSKNMLEGFDEIFSESYSFPNKQIILNELIEFIRQIQLSNKMLLEFELEDLINKSSCKKYLQVLMRYCGWDGGLSKNLREVGKEFHRSPENIRRIFLKLTSIGKLKPYTPALIKAVNYIESRMPENAEIIEKYLKTNKITFSLFRIESIIFAAKIFELNVKFVVDKFKNSRLVVPAENVGVISSVYSFSRKIISHWGVSTIEEIASRMNLNPKIICKTLSCFEDFRLLDKQTGWFWLETVPRNSLLSQIRKILSVSSSISLSELRSGVSRPYRTKGFSPPKRVLLELCKQLSWCKVENDKISLNNPLSISANLNKSELIILNQLIELGLVQQRRVIEKKCLEAGMNKNNITMYLAYCPFIYKYSYGVYGILGANILPGVIDSIQSISKPKRSVLYTAS